MDNFDDYNSTIKASGILFYRTNKNNISVLLGKCAVEFKYRKITLTNQ